MSTNDNATTEGLSLQQLDARIAAVTADYVSLSEQGSQLLLQSAAQPADLPNTRSRSELRVQADGLLDRARMLETAISALQAVRRVKAAEGQTSPPRDATSMAITRPAAPVPQDLPKFRHGANPLQDPEEFLYAFERVLDTHALDPEQHWRRLLQNCLTFDDSAWLASQPVSSATWSVAKDAFLRHFADPDRVYKARLAIPRMRMNPGETLHEFSQRFDKLRRVAMLPVADPITVTHFRESLPREIRFLVEARIRELGQQEPTLFQVRDVALTYAWTPEARVAGRSEPSRAEAPRTVTSVSGHAQVQEAQRRTLERSFARKARRNRAMAGAATGQHAHVAKPAAHAAAAVSAAQRKCYTCGSPTHFANQCPQRTPTARGKPGVKKAVVVSPGQGDAAIPKTLPHADGDQFLTSVKLDGRVHLAQLDSGATRSIMSKKLVDELGAVVTPESGVIVLADPKRPVERIGTTSPIRVQTGTLDTSYTFEVISELEDAQLLIGADLIRQVQGPEHVLKGFGLPTLLADHSAPPADSPMPLTPEVFSDEENSPQFQRYREEVMCAIGPELAANSAISRHEFCPIPGATVELPTVPGKTTFRRQYPLPFAQRDVVDAKIKAWLDDGVIEAVTERSTFNAPFFLVAKKDAAGEKTDFRLCHDYRPLNAILVDDKWPLPQIGDIFWALAGAQVFTTVDLRQAYHRFPIAVADRHKTAFTWGQVQYQFRGAPFGLKLLPSQFQRVMSLLLDGLDFARCFIDDVVIFSKRREDHAGHVKQVLSKLNQAKLILNVEKSHFARLEISLLGFRLNPLGRKMDPARVAGVVDAPVPTTAKQLRSFLGMVSYLREHIPAVSTLTAPLDAIRLKESIVEQWTPERAQAFQRLKDVVTQSPPLVHPDFERPFMVATDASAVGIGAVLYQQDEGSPPRYIQFQARTLTKSERNYSATKRELLAVVFAFARFHQFLFGRRFTLFTDHRALVHLQSQKHLNALQQAWFDELFKYNYEVCHRPGILNVLPDRLSRLFPDSGFEGGSASGSSDGVTVTKAVTRAAAARQAASGAESDSHPPYSVPAPEERANIIIRHHLRGHFGTTAVVNSIHEAGQDWPNLTADVRDACLKCIPCQRHNIGKTGFHPLTPITAAQPWDHIAIDLAGQFPTSHAGNHYLLVVVDVHSRFVYLRAIPDKQSSTVGRTLFDIFTLLGFPKVLQSDRGAEFINSVMKELCAGARIDQRMVTPYHPRANGVAERHVQTAVATVKKMIDGAAKDWDAAVPFAQFAMNTKVARIHRSTPFAVVFGRHANPLDDFSAAVAAPRMSAKDAQARIRFMQGAVFPGIAEIMRASQGAMKASFDASHKQVDIPVGTYVMVVDNHRRTKLDARFEGPFKVVGSAGGAFSLEDNTGALLPRKYPPSALKLVSADPIFDRPSYVVDAIIDHRVTRQGYEYLVRWKHFSKDHDSWEIPSSFDDEATITDYWKRRSSNGRRRRFAAREGRCGTMAPFTAPRPGAIAA